MKFAIENGYRHIDTAYFYKNEEDVGRAINEKIADGTVTREDMFVVTKLWNIHHAPKHVETACRKSLENLGLKYLDLYLMHTPMGFAYTEPEELMPKDALGNLKFSDVDYLDTWRAMEQLVDKGLVKSIGISNFNSEQITRIFESCRIKPVVNQVECNPTINQKRLIQFCKARHIKVTAYSPLTKPHAWVADKSGPKPAFLDQRVIDIATIHKKTPAQVVLRFLYQHGTMPIPKSSNEQRIKENIDIFDFVLAPEEMFLMESLHTGQRAVPFAMCENHPHFMFRSEF